MCVHTYFHYQTAVNNRIISGNLDSPEGGIDGMLQAVVCEDVSCRYTHTHTHTYVCTYKVTEHTQRGPLFSLTPPTSSAPSSLRLFLLCTTLRMERVSSSTRCSCMTSSWSTCSINSSLATHRERAGNNTQLRTHIHTYEYVCVLHATYIRTYVRMYRSKVGPVTYVHAYIVYSLLYSNSLHLSLPSLSLHPPTPPHPLPSLL